MSPSSKGAFACVLRAWQAHEQELLAYLSHRAGDTHTAQDVLQEVFLKAMRQDALFCTLDNPRAWLYQVARNALIDTARRSKPTQEVSEQLPEPTPDEPPPVDALQGCLARTLIELRAEDSHIIDACDLQGQTVREYAQAQGLSLPAAKSRLLRARRRLRERMVTHCQVQFDPAGQVCCHTPRPAD